MPRIISTLPNQSEEVNGVRFKLDRGQYISEDDLDEATAGAFTEIPGYSLVQSPPAPPPPAATDTTVGAAAGTAPAKAKAGHGAAGASAGHTAPNT